MMNGEQLNLENPKTFNEKLNWLKLHDRNPQYTVMVDKYAAKDFVSKKLGSMENIVPCLGVYDSFDDIDFSKLPSSFVIKTTHDSSGVTVCKDINQLDKAAAKKKVEQSLKKDYFMISREWPYKDVPRKVIVDQFIDNHTNHELTDYKFWCFNGTPKVVYVTNKGDEICENFYDMEWHPLDVNHGFPRKHPEFERPSKLKEMQRMASILSEGIPFVRIDFFYVDGHIWFGECTFFDWGGMRAFRSKEWEIKLGDWLQLPEKKN